MRKLLLILIIQVLFDCVRPEKPLANLISKKQMINILVDIHIAEERVNAGKLPKDSAKIMFSELEMEIYEYYKIDKQQFHESHSYYLHNINILDDIYTAVVDSLSVKEALMKGEMR